jgi:type VI secretion system protein ImpK
MRFAEYSDSFLLTQFREFYAEAMRLERLVKTGTWVFMPEVSFDAADPGTAIAPAAESLDWVGAGSHSRGVFGTEHSSLSTAVWQRLRAVFERQMLAAYAHGGAFGAEVYREAQYVMVALADEIFRLLQDRDPFSRDLALIYLQALALGFEGKFRSLDDQGQLARYRRQLFSLIFRRSPDLTNASRQIFPEAYAYTLRRQKRRKLPNPRLWLGALCLVILIYSLLSHGLWVRATSRLDSINKDISTLSTRSEGETR